MDLKGLRQDGTKESGWFGLASKQAELAGHTLA